MKVSDSWERRFLKASLSRCSISAPSGTGQRETGWNRCHDEVTHVLVPSIVLANSQLLCDTMTQTRKHSATSCLHFPLIFPAFSCEIEQIFARSNQNNPSQVCSSQEKVQSTWGFRLLHLCINPHTAEETADHAAVLYSEAKTIVQTSLHVTQAYRLHRSPVSRYVINYTYIDRNNIHYSWASQCQSYFPPFQDDEKILNNRPPQQTPAFQRSLLTLKRLKSELLS